jgi:type I restriction enzyme S subunit
LRVANVLENRIDFTDLKWMNFTPKEFYFYKLQLGDILLNEGQSPELLGRSAIYNGKIQELCFQKTLLRFRSSGVALAEYAQIVFRYYFYSQRFSRASPITTNIAHLTLYRLAAMEFPLPPLQEQKLIVERFQDASNAMHDFGTLIMQTDLGKLRQSILKAAFEGRLVPPDPADEPASALLARLRDGNAPSTTPRRIRPSHPPRRAGTAGSGSSGYGT